VYTSNYINPKVEIVPNIQQPNIKISRFLNTFYEDVNNDDVADQLTYEYKYCEKPDPYMQNRFFTIMKQEEISNQQDTECKVPSIKVEIQDGKTYKLIASRVESLFVGGSTVARLRPVKFGEDTLIVLEYLDLGAHSSTTIIYKIVEDQLIPVCVPNTTFSIKQCSFFSDAAAPIIKDLDMDGIPEIIRDSNVNRGNNFDTIILRDVYVYRNGSFDETKDEEYEKFFQLFKKPFIDKKVLRKYEVN